MIRTLLTIALALPISVHACKLAYVEYEPVFEPGASSLSGSEIKRMAQWRIDTRRAFPAGFQASIMVWQNDHAAISVALAEKRAEHLKSMLVRFGVRPDDVVETEVRKNTQVLSKESADKFFNQAAITLDPGCPHACCTGLEPAR